MRMTHLNKLQLVKLLSLFHFEMATADLSKNIISNNIHQPICVDPSLNNECELVAKESIGNDSHRLMPSSIILNIWDDGCRSYFDDHLETRRGQKIEKALTKSGRYNGLTKTADNFPVVDFFDSNNFVVATSKDLSAETYAADGALYKSILNEAKYVVNKFLVLLESEGIVSSRHKDTGTTISHRNDIQIYFEIVVQSGIGSTAHKNDLARANEALWKNHKIKLAIIEIP